MANIFRTIKNSSNSLCKWVFGGPARTWTHKRTIFSPYTAFFAGFHQVRLTNINSILTLLFTNTKCYWIVLNFRAYRHLYGHLNFSLVRACSGFTCGPSIHLAFLLWLDLQSKFPLLLLVQLFHNHLYFLFPVLT